MIFKFILILFKSIIKQHIKNKFKDRKKLIKDLNDSIDIPFINEKTEEKGIKVLLNLIEKFLLK
jgi:hypothetical protein